MVWVEFGLTGNFRIILNIDFIYKSSLNDNILG